MRIKATFLTMMGPEAYQIHKSNSKADASLTDIKATLAKALVLKRLEYSEICAF